MELTVLRNIPIVSLKNDRGRQTFGRLGLRRFRWCCPHTRRGYPVKLTVKAEAAIETWKMRDSRSQDRGAVSQFA